MLLEHWIASGRRRRRLTTAASGGGGAPARGRARGEEKQAKLRAHGGERGRAALLGEL
jgi:hypothetical protein